MRDAKMNLPCNRNVNSFVFRSSLRRDWGLQGRSFQKLVALNAVFLVMYAITDYSAWTTVSNIPYITHLFWSPIVISFSWSNPPSSSGLISGPNLSFEFLMAMVVANLALAHEDAPRYLLADSALLLAYVPANFYGWSHIISYVSPLQSGLQWNPLSIQIGWGSSLGGVITDGVIFLPNLTLIIALALAIVNMAYTRRAMQLPPKMKNVIGKI
ncbi:MAG: hypothetical protein WED04_13110 [Promethearchaeati archaeon SRVP18_Atabeyarchaeia-1]